MASSDLPDIAVDAPALYEICVRGALDQTWCNLVEGMTLEVVHGETRPLTVLQVVVRDQAELAGLLDVLFGAHAAVLSVKAVEAA